MSAPKCPGMKGANVDGVCQNPSMLPCSNPAAQVVLSDPSYNSGYCLSAKRACPIGLVPGIVESTGNDNGCFLPASCQEAKAGQFCHASSGTVNSLPCSAQETSFFTMTNRRQPVHVCATFLPKACEAGTAGQYCHASTGTLNSTACMPQETTYPAFAANGDSIYVCSTMK